MPTVPLVDCSHVTAGKEYTWYDKNVATPRGDLVHFDAYESATFRLTGNGELVDIDRSNGTAEPIFLISQQNCRGRGYGTEGVALLAQQGFQFLCQVSIQLRLDDFNTRGLCACRAVGFHEAGKRRAAVLKNGQSYDEILMDLVPDELRIP